MSAENLSAKAQVASDAFKAALAHEGMVQATLYLCAKRYVATVEAGFTIQDDEDQRDVEGEAAYGLWHAAAAHQEASRDTSEACTAYTAAWPAA